ncbi:hypothetical protein M408DRAFT_5312 [Serendipita vermifera MAFF 305830]|uniref:Uncharacterized protein n=1 Tax=Serendipita vermifera MAFF 305830 TaxID=933852 RepID=A0A0C3BQW5_SERVB|nr:hypothetical protein M408DRAFT_5312 [Serendipita vermifera MAFF 305830]
MGAGNNGAGKDEGTERSRPQPITAPAPESFLPSFDFGASPKTKSSAPLPPRKQQQQQPAPSLSKRLAAFAFLNLEDIAEEGDDAHAHRSPSSDKITPPASTTSTKSNRFWEFTRSKNTPTTPASLPPMSSKAYATLVGGPATAPSSKSAFSPPLSKVIRQAPSTSSLERKRTASREPELDFLEEKEQEETNPKSLAVDLVSIFSVSNSDDAESSSYGKTRFSFPMPPSSIPRRGSQSPLDPELSFGSFATASPTSPGSDYSFFSPMFSASFTQQMFAPDAPVQSLSPELPPAISPLEVIKVEKPKAPKKKRHSIRPLDSLPPAAPPPRELLPPTPPSPALSTHSQRVAEAAMRACPSPDLDPELSAASSASSITSVMLGADSSVSSSAEESDADDAASIVGPMKAPPRKQSAVDPVDVWGNWGIGAPSRSDSIVTLTQRTYNATVRGSIATASGPSSARNGSFARVDAVGAGRNGSFGSSEVYGDWDKAIDELFSFSAAVSRKPSIASIAFAASADGAAHAGTSLDVLENTAFVMDDAMMQKFMESQFLVPTRHAPTPPPTKKSRHSPHATHAEGSSSTVSLGQTTSSATPSASATSSARSSLDEDRSTHSHYTPMTPVHDPAEHEATLPVVAPLTITKGANKARPVESQPAVNLTRPPRPARPARGGKSMLSAAAPAIELPLISPLDLTHRPPPTQSVPSESSLFSPSTFSNLSLSPQSPMPGAIDLDSWPVWSGIDIALERKRDLRRPSAGAVTMMSKFSDDSADLRPKRSRKESGVAPRTIKKSANKSSSSPTAQNMNPGSSHTSYTFLGMKKKISPSSSPTSALSPPRESVESARSASSAASDIARKEALRRPPLPLELFIRA